MGYDEFENHNSKQRSMRNSEAESIKNQKGNVLILGNSGVGKSTLINAVFGENIAETGFGNKGTTARIEPYENDNIPFRLIDTIGFEPTWFKRRTAIRAVDRWTKASFAGNDQDRQINAIWLCFDGTNSKIFDQTVKAMVHAIGHWNQVPVIAVVTKSYSVPDREQNIRIIREAFRKKGVVRLREIIPVVAQTFTLNDDAFAPPEGIDKLLDVTNRLMPEGIQAAETTIHRLRHHRKQWEAQAVALSAAAAAFGIGAGAAKRAQVSAHEILISAEIAEIKQIGKIYEMNQDCIEWMKGNILASMTKTTITSFLDTVATHIAIKKFKNAQYVVDGVVAAAIVMLIGERSIYEFDRIYQGHESPNDEDGIKQSVDGMLFSPDFIDMVSEIGLQALNGLPVDEVAKSIMRFFGKADSTDATCMTGESSEPVDRQIQKQRNTEKSATSGKNTSSRTK
ncbi:50S ribosome-binding GTPase [Bifidobacterium bohemicum]|uniref:GTP-binding protein n=1 Tax=Bifidobacterium bohemicum DSM 22767 TaxID=1437606 RepID=A0A086ZJ45_9BIFI|nr:GTPase domain-containing protein [Bifidobacterium bohemicum]KFI46545.1 GTP-binding protein [Bifidobacterium bohemicum DSM 22767]SCB74687.1 50S ribosome-binding GTPase [Bifidobacterium bohemicum]